MTKDATVKINNLEKIYRLVSRLCATDADSLLRIAESNILIRATIAAIAYEYKKGNHQTHGLFINNISERGMLALKSIKNINLEIILNNCKIITKVNILETKSSSIITSMPVEIIKIERRKESRTKLIESMRAYIQINEEVHDDKIMMPIFTHHNYLRGWLPIADVSSDGLCAYCPFVGFNEVFKRGQILSNVYLRMPMTPPIIINLEVRWLKKTIDHGLNYSSSESKIEHRIGCQFISPSRLLRESISDLSKSIQYSQGI